MRILISSRRVENPFAFNLSSGFGGNWIRWDIFSYFSQEWLRSLWGVSHHYIPRPHTDDYDEVIIITANIIGRSSRSGSFSGMPFKSFFCYAVRSLKYEFEVWLYGPWVIGLSVYLFDYQTRRHVNFEIGLIKEFLHTASLMAAKTFSDVSLFMNWPNKRSRRSRRSSNSNQKCLHLTFWNYLWT